MIQKVIQLTGYQTGNSLGCYLYWEKPAQQVFEPHSREQIKYIRIVKIIHFHNCTIIIHITGFLHAIVTSISLSQDYPCIYPKIYDPFYKNVRYIKKKIELKRSY